jgi:hypothetical protein
MEKRSAWIFVGILIVAVVIILGSRGYDKITGNIVSEKELVAHYSFENNVEDVTGNGNDAMDVPYEAKYGPGRVGNALDFNKEGAYILVGDKESLNLQEFTMSFWAKLNEPSEFQQGGIGKGNLFSPPQAFSYKIEFSSNKVISAITNIQNEEFELRSPIDDKLWHFWLISVGNGKFTLYKDGVVQGAKDYTGEIDYVKAENEFSIGTSRDVKYSFNGKIDELKIWNYALTENSVWEEYSSYSDEDYCGDGYCNILKEDFETCIEDCIRCQDSDRGLNYYEKGVCKDNKGEVLEDSCGGDDWINEAYCEDFSGEGICKFKSYGCTYGCSNGACLGAA